MNTKKLLNSKWTAVTPVNKEKHFVVIKVLNNEKEAQIVDSVTLEAILTKRSITMNPKELKDSNTWLEGWK